MLFIQKAEKQAGCDFFEEREKNMPTLCREPHVLAGDDSYHLSLLLPFSKLYAIPCRVSFGTYAASVLPDTGASGMLLAYRYSSIMDGKEDSALTGNGYPQRSSPRREITSEANRSLSWS